MGPLIMSAADRTVLNVAPHAYKDVAPSSPAHRSFVSDNALHIFLGASVFVQFGLLTAKLILRGAVNDAQHESHDTMHVVDSFMYTLAIFRNICLIQYVRTQVAEHRIHPQQFRLLSVAREAICGMSAELFLELTLGAVVGISLEIVAFELTFEKLGPAYINYIAQSINFAVLFLLILVVEKGWAKLHVLCRWQQAIQVLLIVYDIVLHSITMSKPGVNHDFRDLRMASLASLIAIRLVSFRFFSFKAHHPELSYVNPLHAPLSVLDGPSSPLAADCGDDHDCEFGAAVTVHAHGLEGA